MTFTDKIDKILMTNKLGIDSVYKLEIYIKAGSGAISRYYKDNKTPGRSTVKKLIDVLDINIVWWDTFEGPIYNNQQADEEVILSHPLVITLKEQIKHMESALRDKTDLIEMLKEEIDRLKPK